MSRPDRRHTRGLAIALLALLSLPALSSTPGNTSAIEDNQFLYPEARHETIGQIVTQFIQKSHYNQVAVDDELSSKVLDFYIEGLDRIRMYLLASDIEFFERYRFELDDIVKSKPLDPVYEMYEVFQTRMRERLKFALSQLENEPDYATDAEYQFDRTESPWAANAQELDDIWRQRVINDALALALEEEPWEKIQDVLTKRYTGFLKRLDQVNNDDVFERFMNTFAHAVDPHSSYLSPRNADEYRIQMSLSYVGIGATLQTEDDFVKIVNIIRGGPADFDGKLKRDDKITAVAQGPEGEFVDVIGWRLDDVVDLIRGPKQSQVRLQIIPSNSVPGSPKVIIPLTRGPVKLEEQAAKSEIVKVPREGREWSIGVIEVPSFYRDYRALTSGDSNYTSVTKDVKRLIGELEEQGIDGLVLDLRGNGGGHLTEATALSGLFIDNGPIVQLRNSIDVRRSPPQRLDDPDPVARVAYNGPLAVLVDRFSASASEIFAGAIQDYNRGVIIGQQTFGKGTVQNLYSLDQYIRSEDDKGFGQLTLTIGKYYRVTGASTQHRGVHPDISLPSNIDAEIVGESSRENALPWDTVDTTRFRARDPLSTTIDTLTSSHVARSKDDPNFQYQVDRIRAAERIREQKTISLNMETRRSTREKELDEALQRENARRTALNLEPIESLDDIDEEELPDVQLDQAAKIVTDMATMREVEVIPAQTARLHQ
ncbi:MAG: carboxy terminal-processing peptidase [Gammaproteobacteria bacterium]|nr:carboxy terminal-processing peptidase [Gammaproteobacteria bacterium]